MIFTLDLLRHGRSEGNVYEKVYGETGDQSIDLHQTGVEQAVRTGELYKSAPPQLIQYSGYNRTRQTLQGFLEGAGFTSEDIPLGIEENANLIEQYFGSFYCNKYADDHVRVRTALNQFSTEAHNKDPFMSIPPNGESSASTSARAQLYALSIKEMAQAGEINHVLAVSHGTTIRLIVAAMLGITTKDILKKFENPGNCDILRLSNPNGQWQVRRFYDGVKGIHIDENPVAHIQHQTSVNAFMRSARADRPVLYQNGLDLREHGRS